MASYLINCIPDIVNKRYLELGVYHKATFNAVMCFQKTSVDLYTDADYRMSTSDFFRQLPLGTIYDIVYIDADHSLTALVSDYNNCIEHLSPDGFLFIHDLIPPDETHTASYYCGDGYKLLDHWIRTGSNPSIYSLNGDYGLTLVRYPNKVNPFDIQQTKYTYFRSYF